MSQVALNSEASLVAQMVTNQPTMQETPVQFLGRDDPLEKGEAPVFLGFPGGLVCKESTHIVGDLGLIPGLGRSPGGGHGHPLQYSGLENPHGHCGLQPIGSQRVRHY